MPNMTCACHIGGTENTKYQCIPSSFDILTIGTCKKCAATVIMGIFLLTEREKEYMPCLVIILLLTMICI